LEIKELIDVQDLNVWMNFGFILRGSFRSFLEIRKLIEEYASNHKDTSLIHSTVSSCKLYVVKEKRR